MEISNMGLLFVEAVPSYPFLIAFMPGTICWDSIVQLLLFLTGWFWCHETEFAELSSNLLWLMSTIWKIGILNFFHILIIFSGWFHKTRGLIGKGNNKEGFYLLLNEKNTGRGEWKWKVYLIFNIPFCILSTFKMTWMWDQKMLLNWRGRECHLPRNLEKNDFRIMFPGALYIHI